METLVTDFIHRGSDMTNHHQAGLSPYWRWILSIYGPQMLDLLGTFRFLITELVPLQLIIQKYRQGAMSEEGDVSSPAERAALWPLCGSGQRIHSPLSWWQRTNEKQVEPVHQPITSW